MMDDVPHFIRAIRSAVQIIGQHAFGLHYFNQIAGALRAPVDFFSASQQLHGVEVSASMIFLLMLAAYLKQNYLKIYQYRKNIAYIRTIFSRLFFVVLALM